MKFITEEFNKFRDDLKDAVKGVEKKYDISIDVSSINYGDTSFDCKLHVKKTDIDADSIEWGKHCYLYGLRAEDYNAIITINGVKYQLKEINTRKRKYPIVCIVLDSGDRVGLNLETVKDRLGIKNQ